MRRPSAFILHALAAGVMTWGWFSLLSNPAAEQVRTTKGGYFLFLTSQGLFLAWACMVVSLFDDVFPAVKVVRYVKRMLLMMSLPLEFVITSTYWPLLLFLPHILVPQIVIFQTPAGTIQRPPGVSLSIDLALHATPLIMLLIDFFVFEPKFSKTYTNKTAPSSVLVFTVWYASFVEYYASLNGSFPYPFLTYSLFPVRVMIYASAAGVALGCFRSLNALHA